MQVNGVLAYQNLATYLRAAVGVLELETFQLRQDVLTLSDYLENPSFRIAVFGPFNYGKSTLLNALLGERALPIDLIPTTGAAILVRYGEKLKAKITLQDGTEISNEGTQILKEYAILDNDRRMRNEVASVEVYCPHPFLQTGVEFLDLPGTNDREAQDALVRDRLLTADLIVQVLDGRKLMTLGEREHLRDWLLDRGINTVVFVVNFLNLLDPEEQKQVQNRLRFLAESFRAELPSGISNLYRVDALPALRARLKGDTAAAQTTGLATFEAALQTIVTAHQAHQKIKLARVTAVAKQVLKVGEEKKQAILAAESEVQKRQQEKVEIQQKAEKLIKQGWQRSLSDFQGWLYLPKLLTHYQAELAVSLQQGKFPLWEEAFKQTISAYQQKVEEWVRKSCEFFEQELPEALSVPLPGEPDAVSETPQPHRSDDSIASVAIPAGLGWALGGPVGAAVLGGASYLFNKAVSNSEFAKPSSDRLERPRPKTTGLPLTSSVSQVYAEAAEVYLTRFSQEAFAVLREYEARVEPALIQSHSEADEKTKTYYQLQLLNNLLENLRQTLLAIDELPAN